MTMERNTPIGQTQPAARLAPAQRTHGVAGVAPAAGTGGPVSFLSMLAALDPPAAPETAAESGPWTEPTEATPPTVDAAGLLAQSVSHGARYADAVLADPMASTPGAADDQRPRVGHQRTQTQQASPEAMRSAGAIAISGAAQTAAPVHAGELASVAAGMSAPVPLAAAVQDVATVARPAVSTPAAHPGMLEQGRAVAAAAAAADQSLQATGAAAQASDMASGAVAPALLSRVDGSRRAQDNGTTAASPSGGRTVTSTTRLPAPTGAAGRQAALAMPVGELARAASNTADGGPAFGAVAGRGIDRAAPRPVTQPAGAPVLGVWMEAAPAGGTAAATPVFAPDPALPAPAAALADRLGYWVSRGMQNAELQLDAFGGGSVDVSISMQGNEALVEFRTDQPEARRMLQEAMPQLRDMLKGEGLVLAGGFVGTSAQSDPGARQHRAPTAGNRLRLAEREVVSADPASPLSRTPGRVVDLFV